MRELNIRIKSESSGFEVEEEFKDVPNCTEEAVSWEFARILRGIADNMDMYSWEKYKKTQQLKDQHNNVVGAATIIIDPEPPKFLVGDIVEVKPNDKAPMEGLRLHEWMVTDRGSFRPEWYIIHNLDENGIEVFLAVHEDNIWKPE